MCRLFGFRSVIESQVHSSLLAADNALAQQSLNHPDGWGVAFYLANAPHIIRNTDTAVEDQIFQRVSGVVASETVLAHLRKATTGEVNILNSHPFQYGQWVMAHNGQINDFESIREVMKSEVDPRLRRYILGDTDSEVLFFLFLTHLRRLTDLHRSGTDANNMVEALRETVKRTRELADGEGDEEKSKLNVIVTDGKSMIACRSGIKLLYSTYKSRCVDRDKCPFLSPECEAPSTSGFVNHLIVSSEELQGDNIWIELEENQIIGVDWKMKLVNDRL